MRSSSLKEFEVFEAARSDWPASGSDVERAERLSAPVREPLC
ncbi:MAG TPA: hypothetical protein VGB17_11000 [Pyrinomonadaceae bacterium]